MLAAGKFLAFQTCKQGLGKTDSSDAAYEVLCWRLATSSKRHTFSPQQSPSTSSSLTGPVYLQCLTSVPCRRRAKLSHKPSPPTPSFLSYCPWFCLHECLPFNYCPEQSFKPPFPSPPPPPGRCYPLSILFRPLAPTTLLFMFFLLGVGD